MDYKIGDEVFWNDPDEGKTSAYYAIAEFLTDDIVLLKNNISETEAFIKELT